MTTTTKTIGRSLADGTYVEITAELRIDDPRGLSDAFSVTCSGWEKQGTWDGRACKRNGRESVFGGADHDLILRAAPELAPIVKAHLADPNGTPMHAEANGWYFYTGKAAAYEREHYSEEYATRFGTDHERAARALHIAPADLPEGLDREGFAEFVQSLKATWAGHAANARAALESMTDGDGVEDILERHRS